MDDKIVTKAFSTSGACSSKFVTERKSCKIEEEPEEDILFRNNSSNSREKITNFSKMFDDAFSYKKEPSINFDIEYHSHQTGFYDNDINLDELPQSDIYLEEGSRSQHDIDQNICLDNIAGDTDEDGQPDGFAFSLPSSAALSDHNYNRNANYKYFKNLVYEIEKIINISKTGVVSIQFIEQISKLIIEIKKEFGLDSSLIAKNIKEEFQLPDNETSQKNATKTFNLKNIKTSQTTDSIDLKDKAIYPEISTTTLDLNREPGTSNVIRLDNNIESYGGEEIFDLNENSLNKKPVNLNFQNGIKNIKKENIIKTEIERVFEQMEGNFVRNYNSTPEIIIYNQENDGMEVENEPNEIETNENDVGKIKNTSKNENVATVKDISELENEINDDIHRENLESQNQTENQKEQEENLEYNSDELMNEVEPISSGQNNADFPENCSEPLEYDAKTDSCINSEIITEQMNINDGDELIAPDIELTKNKDLDNDQEKLNELHTFGMRLVKSCEDRKKNKIHTIDDAFLNELILDFQKIAYRKTYADISIQTNYSGRHLSKEKQRRINEKEKKRLLADSDSCSDEASDLSEVYTSEENLSPIMDGNISDENTRSPPSVELHDSDSDGLDLRKYISVNYSDTENADNQSRKSIKATETRSAVSLQDVNNGSCIESDTDDNKMDECLQNEDKQIFQVQTNNDLVQHDNFIDSEDHLGNANISSICIPSDEKLHMDAVVIVEKLTDNDLENYYDELREKEIDRLLNLKSLGKRRVNMVQYTNHDRVVSVPKKSKSAKLLEILNDTDKVLDSDESNTEEENEVITEKEYLNRCNETLKQQLLETTSSDSEAEAELSAEEEELANDSDSSNDSNLPPLVDKFLENLTVNEFDKEGNDESNTKESEIICDVEPKDVVIFADDESDNEQVVKDNSNGSVVVVSAAATTIAATASGSGVIADNKKDSILITERIENKIENHNTSEDEKSSEKEKTSTRINVGYSKRLLSEKNFDIKAIESAATIQKDSVVGKDESEDSDCEILHDSLLKKPRKEKTLDVLLAEYDKRRKNTKVDESAISLSSESASELDEGINEEEEESQRRVLKPMLRQDQLAGETRIAQKEEYERLRRLDKKQEFLAKALKEYYKDVDKEKRSKELILDYNSDTKTFIKVNPDIVKQLKKHQVEGVKFMYDVCYGSVEFLKKHPGSGCILAHCMGLGKTLQLIALLHTVITYKELKTSKILVLCPKSTVMNWKDEIQRWLGPISPAQLKVYSFPDTSDIQEKLRLLQEWSTLGTTGNRKAGCFLMGYEAFRTLVFYHLYKKQKNCLTASDLEAIKRKVKETLLHPGADLVICDEGHIIKNRKSAISTAVAEIKTLRRIILTGTPIQNNLKEYYSMVNFIKPSFLGTEREFANLYANPIRCGQHKDSSKKEIKIMKQRSFVLHKKLSKFVQRREAALLKSFLPEKYEYVLFIPMTNVQNALYEFFLNSISMREGAKGKNLIPDYTCLRKIWTHPKVLENAWQNAIIAKNRRESKKTPTRINSDDEEPDDIYDSQTGALSVTKDWWRPLILDKDLLSLLASNKLRVMFEILRMCGENGEKCLIFSAFVAVLNVVEYFMKQIHSKDLGRIPPSPDLGLGNFKGPWVEGEDYYRLDGKTPKSVRHEMVKMFNDPENRRARCFLISAKAGGQGINLIGANRVIILDTSWNPSNDQQNIFRIFRLGQKRECFVYRLLTMGTMEEKVYSRSVTKQAMSFRVVDEQQIDRHYSMAELQELYTLTKPNYADRPVPPRPMDNVLASLLHNFPSMVFKYHEHDSLLENKLEQELSEQEKADAWNAYELDLQAQANAGLPPPPIDNMGMFPGAGNFLPPFAGFTGRNYPISYAPGMHGPIPPQLLPPYYNSSNAIMDIYNMYQNFPVSAGPLMSRLNSANPLNNGHPYQSATNSLLGPPNSMTNPNMNMLPPGMNNLSALTALPPFSSLSSMPQSTSNNTLTSQSPVYSTINNITPQFHSPPSSVDSFRRFLETNNQRPTLDMGSQQKATNSHQVTSAESIPTSVITNSDIHFGQFRDHLGESSDQRSSPKAHLMQKTGSTSLPVSSLSQMLTSNARSNPISTQASNQQTAKRGVNMGILYPVHSSAKLSDNVGPGGNISVRSVNSINNATNNSNYISSSVTATPVNSLNKAPVTYPIVDKNISRGPTTSLQSSITPVLNKEPAVINAASNKSFGNVNQIQLSSYQAGIKKPTKNNTNAVTSIASTNNNNNSNGVSIRALHPSSSSVTQSKVVTNKPSTSSISKPVISQIITSPKVSNNVMKTANKSIVQSTNSSPLNSNSAKSIHGNSIRTKIVHRPMSSNLSPASVITKPSISNSAQNSIRPNHTVNVPNTPKGNQTIPGTTILPAMNKSRSQVLASSSTNKTSTMQNPAVEAQKQQARNNAALNSLSGRNNISIRPVENKFNNPGITISPGRKIQVGAATSSTSVKSTNSSSPFTNNVTSLLKDAVSRKRSSSSNITLMLPDNSPISVRQIKRPKLVSVTTPPSLGVRNTTDPLARVQTNQGLTIVPRSAQNNQRLPPKEGKTPEVVEID